MEARDEGDAPVEAKAVLLDPVTTNVLWMNEAAARDMIDPHTAVGRPLAEAMPMPEQLHVAEALASVAATGEPAHLRAGLVSTVRGRLAVVASVYRLPDGALLMLIDTAFEADHRKPGTPRGGRGAPRRR